MGTWQNGQILSKNGWFELAAMKLLSICDNHRVCQCQLKSQCGEWDRFLSFCWKDSIQDRGMTGDTISDCVIE